MDAPLEQLGIGGIFALMLLDKVFTFLKKRNHNGAGEKSVEFWREQGRDIMKAVVADDLAAIRLSLHRIGDATQAINGAVSMLLDRQERRERPR